MISEGDFSEKTALYIDIHFSLDFREQHYMHKLKFCDYRITSRELRRTRC